MLFPVPPRFWIGVASREHVKIGEAGEFCQLCHGKTAPVRALRRGDGLIYYSPRQKMRQGATVQAFTAIGRITDDEPYPYEQAPGFVPMRRNLQYFDCTETLIRPLLDQLSFLPASGSWGMVFRRGAFEIPRADFLMIAAQMGISEAHWL